MSNRALVETKELYKIYKTGTVETPALRGVDLGLHSGEFTAIASQKAGGCSAGRGR